MTLPNSAASGHHTRMNSVSTLQMHIWAPSLSRSARFDIQTKSTLNPGLSPAFTITAPGMGSLHHSFANMK